jgi:acyl-CoA hydrolase
VTIEVELWAEGLLTGERRRSAAAEFVMVAVDEAGRPRPISRPMSAMEIA